MVRRRSDISMSVKSQSACESKPLLFWKINSLLSYEDPTFRLSEWVKEQNREQRRFSLTPSWLLSSLYKLTHRVRRSSADDVFVIRTECDGIDFFVVSHYSLLWFISILTSIPADLIVREDDTISKSGKKEQEHQYTHIKSNRSSPTEPKSCSW